MKEKRECMSTQMFPLPLIHINTDIHVNTSGTTPRYCDVIYGISFRIFFPPHIHADTHVITGRNVPKYFDVMYGIYEIFGFLIFLIFFSHIYTPTYRLSKAGMHPNV